MTIEGLGFINGLLTSMQIPYEFMEWTSDLPDTYFVGEEHELASMDEGGLIESEFILMGTTKDKFLKLKTVQDQIRKNIPVEGLTCILPNGWGIAICYDSGFPVPSVEEGIHRIQITLNIKEWKGE